ncbi:ATP-dependent helicase HrpB [Thalassotalea euphylliae]|uniref:ATP-dependent helicase HrpB n=1 Tax=Thalassotalea euphylliae TaxID=1655234 RepID=A0A3E0U6V5_9GAMM|nr:ATP-dependent helicase HrpB [Thalassotalea euphylliae]REL31662.1 ATP-dependent helicase HrpB [Thalassotalea euphylliae]
MSSFPIEQIKADFLSALATQQTLVLSAPPGAGKSTVLPLWLLDTAKAEKTIYLLQPRRVAAKNIATYLASQLREPVGQTVGYRLRNDSKVSSKTKLEVITEGILTQLLQEDPELSKASLILFDEFHERSVQGDVAFALARDCQQGLRDDLTLVLMSATLATEELLTQLPDAVSLHSEGRSYPVDSLYLPVPNQVFWREHALKVIRQHAVNHSGSTLVFLPGVADIRYLADQLADHLTGQPNALPDDLRIAPLFGEQSLAEQQRAMKAVQGQRKIVLATNIAETSLTIDGITLVIDAGFEKVARYDVHTMTNQLSQQAISKASAIQRAGRAGRLAPGHCIRLYGEEDFQRRPEQATPAILQTDLLPVLMEAARWGVTSLADLPLLDQPNEVLTSQGWHSLTKLKIVDEQHKLTKHGQQVAKFSCHPRFAHMLVAAQHIATQVDDEKILNLGCLLAALLEERDILSREASRDNADIGIRVDMVISKEKAGKANGAIARIVQQAKQLARQLGRHFDSNWQANISRDYCGLLLALAYPERIAKKRGQQASYLSSAGKGLSLADTDPLNEESLIVAANTIKLGNQQRISLAAPVSLAALEAWQVLAISEQDTLTYDEQKDAISASKKRYLGAIVLAEQPSNAGLTAALVVEMWHQQLAKKGLTWLKLSDEAENLRSRICWLAVNQPELALPVMDNEWLMVNLADWFDPYVGDIKKKSALLALDFATMLHSVLDYSQQQALAQKAPRVFIGPTGRKCPIRYPSDATNELVGKSPTVSLPMQEVYGLSDSPQVGDSAQGKGINLTLELLSPAGRPLQVTQDLAGFWQGSYQQVQKEMKGRYPKHYWPDDPANAQATSKTKRFM